MSQAGVGGRGGGAGASGGAVAGQANARGGTGGGPAPDEGGAAGLDGMSGEGGSDDGECDPPSGNFLVPSDFPTIQAAIDAAADGDSIVVAAGIYLEHLDFLGKAIRLVSEDGPATTVIDGTDNGPVMTIRATGRDETLIDGFTITHGQGPWGGGITLEFGGSPTIRGNWFIANQQAAGGFGAAIGGNGASPLVDSNYFEGNSCDDQHLSGVLAFVNGSSARIINNVLYGNDCRGINFTVPEGVAPEASNNTLVGNRTGIYVGAQVPTVSQIYRNNVIVGGTIGLDVAWDDNRVNAPTWIHNLVYGCSTNFQGIDDPTGTLGNVSVEPKLVDVSRKNFRLLDDSPAIDAGSTDAPPTPAFDFDHRTRPFDGDGDQSAEIDLGAFEHRAPRVCPYRTGFAQVP
jgi:serine protease